MTRYQALLLAGSRPGEDAFAHAYGVANKALIPVAGQPMICRPLRALIESDEISGVKILTQDPDQFRELLAPHPGLTIERSGTTIASTLEQVCLDPGTRWPLLVTTADHALLDIRMIADICGRAEGSDLAIGVVERRDLARRLPQVKRTWISFRNGSYSGANLFVLGSPAVGRAIRIWRDVEQDRKKGWRLLLALGAPGLLGLLRIHSLDRTLQSIGQKLGLEIRAIEMRDPLAAVDVDKPSDHELVSAILKERA